MTAATATLKKTPLFQQHQESKARMVDFGGWHMPVMYSGIVEEHHAVRNAVGLFDVSHMGEIDVTGPEAERLINFIATNNASKLQVGQAQYSALLYPHGGFVDDILVHKVSPTHFFLCVNAANQEKDFEHIRSHNGFNAKPEFTSESYAQLAIQGPNALPTLQKLTAMNLSGLRYYWFTDGTVLGHAARIARTGYTGEDGFEIYTAPDSSIALWKELLNAGAGFGIKPCGLGARNTLRLEAKMPLYGHEITASINPYEADLGWIVKPEKGEFLGRTALEDEQREGLKRKLVGFEMTDRGVARDGYEVWINGTPAGWVTSGGPSPSLGKNIGLCYLPVEHAKPGVPIQILIRETPVAAITVATPFYKRPKA